MPKRRRSSTTKEFSTLVGMLSPSVVIPSSRHSPLPNINWADASDVWEYMQNKEKVYTRNALLLYRHSGLEARMRAILLDWLAEVCEVYQLHKETYYLAIDYIDRYLSIKENIPKHCLQLIGVTCLFIAAKTEEIYPPKISEFAYVTDNACSEKEILLKELVILKALNWQLYPMTVISWLNVYMQLYTLYEKENKCNNSNNNNESSSSTTSGNNNSGEYQIKRKRRRILCDIDYEVNASTSSAAADTNAATASATVNSDAENFLIPDFSTYFFTQITHLIDLCIFDIGSLRFPYSVIAASALYHFTNEDVVAQCTAYTLNDIKDCVLWLTPFAMAIREEGFDNPKLQIIANTSEENLFNLQSHTADLPLLEKAHKKQDELDAANILIASKSNKEEENNKNVTSDKNNNDCNENIAPNTAETLTKTGPPSSPIPSTNVLTPPKSHSKAAVN